MSSSTQTTQHRLRHVISAVRRTKTLTDLTFADYILAMRTSLAANAPATAHVRHSTPTGGPNLVRNRPQGFHAGRGVVVIESEAEAPGPLDRLSEHCRLADEEDKIRTILRASLRLAAMESSGGLSKEGLLRLYLESLALLDGHRESFARFLDALLEDQLKLDLPPDDELVQRARRQLDSLGNSQRQSAVTALREHLLKLGRESMLNQLMPRLGYDPSFTAWSSIATAQLFAREDEEFFQTLKADVIGRIERLARWVTTVLETGVRNGFLGFAAWVGKSLCWYSYLEQWAELTGFELDANWSSMKVGATRWKYGFAAHEVHLIKAEQLEGVPGWMRLPPRIEKIVAAIPPLLRQHVATIDGTVVRERVVRGLISNFQTSNQIEIPLPTPVLDPAIVIGNIVLAGWSKVEVNRIWRFADYLQLTLLG